MNTNLTPLAVFNQYNDALVAGDFPKAMAMFAPDVIWHQPGNNKLSGTINGAESLGAHLGKFMEESQGTFKIMTNWVSENGNLVAANVTFTATKNGVQELNLDGIDLFKIEGGLIKEVWLFTSNQATEDSFWG